MIETKLNLTISQPEKTNGNPLKEISFRDLEKAFQKTIENLTNLPTLCTINDLSFNEIKEL